MNVFELTRALVDIESITLNEERLGEFLHAYLAPLAARYGGTLERIPVEPRRFNLFAQWGERLAVTLSTHLDTVPPFFAAREDEEYIWGRGACDTKGIIAAMIEAVKDLLAAGRRGFGLLFVVGEERNSAGPGGPRKRREGRGISLTANPPGTSWRWDRRARCAMKWWPRDGWRIRPIPSWAIRRFTS